MAILVDEARWPWQGTHWCHLVSDSALLELHEFAGELGCRRVGFQGDHYDIDITTRERALSMGAEACTSRDLVRRLRSAGLRLRPSSFAKWQLEERWDPLADVAQMIDRTGRLKSEHHAVLRSLATFDLEGGFALQRNGSVAAVVFGSGSVPSVTERPEHGVHVRVQPSGRWSVELVHPPLTDVE